MAATTLDGPVYTYGNGAAIPAAIGGSTGIVGDPNTDAGPNGVFQGVALIDPRYYFEKDRVTGYAGRVPSHLFQGALGSVNQVPVATSATKIAAAQAVTSGTAMTLAADSLGATNGVPIIPFSVGGINNGTSVTVMALDFGFAFGTVVANSTTITVNQGVIYYPGTPIVIGGAGSGGAPLLTRVFSQPTVNTIVVTDTPATSVTPAPIGTGNTWGPSETPPGAPVAALPWWRDGPGLILDPRQSVARAVRIVGGSGSTGGNFTVNGYDIYNMPMTETVTVAAEDTGYGIKAFKYILSVVPGVTDAALYSVGTADVFGFHYRCGQWEDSVVTWDAITMTATQGWTGPLSVASTSTAITADVRGTIQTSAIGGGTGIGSTSSNGTVSALRMAGSRLTMRQLISPVSAVTSFPADSKMLFGVNQF